jgi:copper chaperone
MIGCRLGRDARAPAAQKPRTTMQQEFRIEGMHCNGCVARVTKALETIADDVQVTLDPPLATLETTEALSLEEVKAAVKKAGDYVVTPA